MSDMEWGEVRRHLRELADASTTPLLGRLAVLAVLERVERDGDRIDRLAGDVEEWRNEVRQVERDARAEIAEYEREAMRQERSSW